MKDVLLLKLLKNRVAPSGIRESTATDHACGVCQPYERSLQSVRETDVRGHRRLPLCYTDGRRFVGSCISGPCHHIARIRMDCG